MSKQIGQGAEATIVLDKDIVIKTRHPKTYRIKEIDEELVKTRTKKEAKILEKLYPLTPKVISLQKDTIKMEFIKGELVKDILDKNPNISIKIGKETGKMHDLNIIHGDLTTSNMILQNENIRFIDFGLSNESHKIEDKAVDLHLFKEAVESKHFRQKEKIWENFLKGYACKEKKQILSRLEKVEQRGRNKTK